MKEFNHVKDSGQRYVNENGGNRDTAEGKLDYTLVPIESLDRLVRHYHNGLVKYQRDNWKLLTKPEDIDRFKQSALRHMYSYLRGSEEEDHLAAVIWNCMSLIYHEEQAEDIQVSDEDLCITTQEKRMRENPAKSFLDLHAHD